jgi:hypothetical protein
VAGSCDTAKPVGLPHFVYTAGDEFVGGGSFTADSGTIELCTDGAGDTRTGDTIDIDAATPGIPATATDTTVPVISSTVIANAAESLSPDISSTDTLTDVAGSYLTDVGIANASDILTRYKLYLFETYYQVDGNSCGEFLPTAYDACTGQLAHERRIVRVVVIDCEYWGVSGKTSLDMELDYIDVFLTEQAEEPPDATFYAEVLREPEGSSIYNWGGTEDEVLNVRLVE